MEGQDYYYYVWYWYCISQNLI